MAVMSVRSVGVAMSQLFLRGLADGNDFNVKMKCLARKGMIPVDFYLIVFDFHDRERVFIICHYFFYFSWLPLLHLLLESTTF